MRIWNSNILGCCILYRTCIRARAHGQVRKCVHLEFARVRGKSGQLFVLARPLEPRAPAQHLVLRFHMLHNDNEHDFRIVAILALLF